MNPDLPPAAGETIGQRLKRLRLERGFSQRELAAPGVSYAYISRIEAGSRQPSVKALRRLAAKLGVTAGYLETGSDLDAAADRELRLSDLELAIRLGEPGGTEAPLRELVGEATGAGDRPSALRALVALAALVYDRGDFAEAVSLLEAALADEPFAPVELAEVYSQLARAYVSAGRTQAAVDLFERCLDEVSDSGDTSLEARYATLLSYALSDMGELGRAEQAVRRALDLTQDTQDPYTRVRLYWSMARLAHAEGKAALALTNVRKAIALLQATDDTLHLARAHVLAASITLSRDDADEATRHLDLAEQLFGASAVSPDRVEIAIRRSRVAFLRGQAERAITLARSALELIGDGSPVDEGLAFAALGDALGLADERPGAGEAYRRAVDLLETQGYWRDAAHAARSWGRLLRRSGDEAQALDVLERAAELGMRAAPAEAHISER
ncbi:MAG TPA: tetratricopeptide repeat protein [Gaiellaceae bacterium]